MKTVTVAVTFIIKHKDKLLKKREVDKLRKILPDFAELHAVEVSEIVSESFDADFSQQYVHYSTFLHRYVIVSSSVNLREFYERLKYFEALAYVNDYEFDFLDSIDHTKVCQIYSLNSGQK